MIGCLNLISDRRFEFREPAVSISLSTTHNVSYDIESVDVDVLSIVTIDRSTNNKAELLI